VGHICPTAPERVKRYRRTIIITASGYRKNPSPRASTGGPRKNLSRDKVAAGAHTALKAAGLIETRDDPEGSGSATSGLIIP